MMKHFVSDICTNNIAYCDTNDTFAGPPKTNV